VAIHDWQRTTLKANFVSTELSIVAQHLKLASVLRCASLGHALSDRPT